MRLLSLALAALALQLSLPSARAKPGDEPAPAPEPTFLPAPTKIVVGVGENHTLAALSNWVQMQSKRHPHGMLFVRGAVKPVQFFRALYGGLLPCGSRDLVEAPAPEASAAGAAAGPSAGAFADLCKPLPRSALLGRFVVVRRGNCSFTDKALTAQRAGAAGVLIANHEEGLFRMAFANNSAGFEVVIPLVMVPLVDIEPLLAFAAERGRPLHASLAPVRDDCVDPQVEDEERRRFADEANVPYTAALASRVAPSLQAAHRALDAQAAASASVGRAADSLRASGTPEGLAAANMLASDAAAADLVSRLPQTWPPVSTHAVTLTIGVRAPPPAAAVSAIGEAAEVGEGSGSSGGGAAQCGAEVASYLPEEDAELYLAEFSAPALGDSAELAFAEPPRACGNLSNAARVAGKFVIVFRGDCTMVDKARNVQAAGGRAVILVNFGAESALETPEEAAARTARRVRELVAAAAEAEAREASAAREAALARAAAEAAAGDVALRNASAAADAAAAAARAAAAAAAAAIGAPSEREELRATSTHSNPSFGVVRAVGDAELAERPVRIPVAMVSAEAARTWFWEGAGGVLGSVAGCSATLTPSRAQATAGWEELEPLRVGGRGAWPEDAFFRQRFMLGLLRSHHPKAALGHAGRFRFLLAAADEAGFGFELRNLEAALAWEDGVDQGHTSDDFGGEGGKNRTLAGNSPGLAFLIANMPAAALAPRWATAEASHALGGGGGGGGAAGGAASAAKLREAAAYRESGLGQLACATESGTSYSVRLTDFDRASTFGLTRRLKDLLAQQACLEKLLVGNAATIGAYLGQLREESSVREWREASRGLLRHYRVPDDDASRVASSYIELSQAVSSLGGAGDESIAQAFSLGEKGEEEAPRRAERAENIS